MPFDKNPYIWAGHGLLIAGSLVSLSAYFTFLLAWLTALGASACLSYELEVVG